jgi:preprotein translocase subunit SecD
MTGEGSPLLEQVTRRLIGLPITFFLDGEPIRGEGGNIIAPTVMDVVSDRGRITGLGFEDGRVLSAQLNAGALPAALKVVSIEELSR